MSRFLKLLLITAATFYFSVYLIIYLSRQEKPTAQWISFIGYSRGRGSLYFYDLHEDRLTTHQAIRGIDIGYIRNHYQQNLISVAVNNHQTSPEIYDFYIVRPFSNHVRYLFTDLYHEMAWLPGISSALVAAPIDNQWDIFERTQDGIFNKITNDVHIEAGLTSTRDGKWILFSSDRDGSRELYKMRRDGSQITRLTNSSYSDKSPSASPDGKSIAFASLRDGEWEIYVTGEDTTPRRLTMHIGLDDDPAWSPDGQWIGFVSADNSRETIYLMRPDGRDKHQIVPNFDVVRSLVWSPIYDYPLNVWCPAGGIIVFILLLQQDLAWLAQRLFGRLTRTL
jgi:dipeptidyl aminopeptidase/acylaminoacyl peptidase